ncbi:MAG: nucleotidyltransferase substrate binding protein [Rhodospirillales bacterium]|nr:nucleotidyltransferase substrate binding protein [Rhodospirillales bacterium]
MERLDLSSLRRALETLDEGLAEYARDSGNAFVRDACIQRFEYCYALATGTIDRQLAMTGADPGAVQKMAFQDRIRAAYAAGILRNSWDRWRQYRDDRAATAQGYDEDRARAIAGNLPAFAAEARFLLDQLAQFHAPKA